jgi:hypothetical protein
LSNTYEIKKIEIEMLKNDRDRYIRQKEIKYSELEKLQLDEKIIEKELEISRFIQEQLEKKMKYQARLEVLNELIPVFQMKDKEISTRYNLLLENRDGISELDLEKMGINIKLNKNEIKKSILEKNFIEKLLKSEEFEYIDKSLKEDKIINIVTKSYDNVISIKNQELRVIEIEQKGDSFLKDKKNEVEMKILEKELEIENDKLNMENLKVDYENLVLDKENMIENLKFVEKDIDIFQQKVDLGAGSQKDLLDKILEKYEYIEEKIKVEGEIRLKEIELEQ